VYGRYQGVIGIPVSNSLKSQIKALVKSGELKKPDQKMEIGQMQKCPQNGQEEVGEARHHKLIKQRRRNRPKKRKAEKPASSAPNFSQETIRSAFGGPDPSKQQNKPALENQKPIPTVIRVGSDIQKAWSPNALIETPLLEQTQRGNVTSLSPNSADFEQIQLGFDFGTSSVKVVARLDSDNSLIPIYFRKGPGGLVLPSRLFIVNGYASLEAPSDNSNHLEFLDLKLPLLEASPDPESLVRASLFIALVVRRVRAYIYETHKRLLSNKQIFWLINFGVPASFQDEKHLQNRFRDVFDSAAYLAVQPAKLLSVQAARKAWKERAWEQPIYQDLNMTLVQLVPEIAAQIYAIMRSEQWDSSVRLFTVIDVGAGTVDIGVVSVTGKVNDISLSFFYTAVINHGAAMLNRHRVDAILANATGLSEEQLIYFDSIKRNTAIDKRLPDTWRDYLAGSERVSGSFDPDYDFAMTFLEDVELSRSTVIKDGNFGPSYWKNHRVILCGGGRNEPLYSKSLDKMTKNSSSNIGFDVRIPSRSREVESAGISQSAYERVSVAYGLSFSFDLYPKLTLANDIPAFAGREKPPSFDSRFVGKDSV